jgi:hypothetical protein
VPSSETTVRLDFQPRAKVYLDANVFKFSATRLLRAIPRETLIVAAGWVRQFHDHLVGAVGMMEVCLELYLVLEVSIDLPYFAPNAMSK